LDGKTLTHIEKSPIDLEQWMIVSFGKAFTKNRIIVASEEDSNFWAK
jgi:hypothetical protein